MIFAGFVIAVDFFVVALFINRSFENVHQLAWYLNSVYAAIYFDLPDRGNCAEKRSTLNRDLVKKKQRNLHF